MDEKTVIKTKYDAKYDIVKFVMSLLVVAIHASLYPYVIYPWVRMAVPLFFMISAYFIFGKLHHATGEQQKEILKKYVVRNALLYVCWFVVLSPMTYLTRGQIYFGHGVGAGIRELLRNLFFGNTFLASWFIPAAVFGVLIIYVLCNRLRKDVLLMLLCALVFALVTLRSAYDAAIYDTWLGAALRAYERALGNPVFSFPAAIVWVFLGKCFAEHKVHTPPLWVLLPLLAMFCAGLYLEWRWVLSWSGSYGHDSLFMLLPVCVTVFALIERCNPIDWKWSIHFKRASTVIYVSHASILPVFNEVGRRFLGGKIPLFSFVATACTCVVGYIAIAFLAEKTKGCKIGKVFRWMY